MLPRVNHVGKRFLTLSAVQGPLHPPLVSTTLSQYFTFEILAKNSQRPALISRQERPRAHGGPASKNLGIQKHLAWDFEEFDRHIGALARGLLGMGVKKGDRIGVIMGNNRLRWLDFRGLPRTYYCYAVLMPCFNCKLDDLFIYPGIGSEL